MKKFFAKFNHDTPSIIPDIIDSLVEPYATMNLQQIISVIHKLNAYKTLGEDGIRASNSSYIICQC